ncbi:hypothetical protein KY362_06850, partial [Candidatus Woesearchaeota archaeon]|nr:hypothetical protein [Candidatus Woesearchaeota archaeon]
RGVLLSSRVLKMKKEDLLLLELRRLETIFNMKASQSSELRDKYVLIFIGITTFYLMMVQFAMGMHEIELINALLGIVYTLVYFIGFYYFHTEYKRLQKPFMKTQIKLAKRIDAIYDALKRQ